MITGSVILYGIAIAIALWMLVKITRFRHKILAIFVIALILFGYFSFNTAFKGQAVDLKDFRGLTEASAVYFSWLGSVFGNAQTITSRVVENNSRDKQPE
ncbi:MAG: hypothetical protein AABY15_01235 [Nanoarchaeota archaeon]